MHHFFAYLSKMKQIRRWSLMRNTQEENVKEHSFDVALISHGLALIANTYFEGKYNPEEVLALGLLHEAGEVITGDLPTPIKYYNPEIRRAYDQVEQVALRKIHGMLPEELQLHYTPYLFHEGNSAYSLVKAADKLCAYIKCLEEVKGGNQEFQKAREKIRGELEQFAEPEVQYFIREFLPSYELALDELN